jgi:hypothetical protein
VVLGINQLGLSWSVTQGCILQFALTARIAYWAVQGMVLQHKFQHGFASLLDFLTLGRNHHPLADERGAGRLQLGHLGDFHEAHPASALQR